MNKRVNGAVKIKITLSRKLSAETEKRLTADLHRLTSQMTTEEYTEYCRRISND